MTDPRRASQDLFVRLLRQGLHDSEIGVRLGINTGEVRERKAELRRRLGDEEYLRLLDPNRKVGRRIRWKKWALMAGAPTTVIAILLLIANVVVDDGEDVADVRATPTSTPVRAPLAAGSVQVDGVSYDDAGAFFAPPVGQAEAPEITNRAGFSFVSFAQTTYVAPNDVAQWYVSAGGRGQLRFRATVNQRPVEVMMQAADSSTRIRRLTADVGVIAELSSVAQPLRSKVILRAYGSGGDQVPLHVTDDGRLLIGQAPLANDWIVERQTGQRVGVENGVEFAAITEPVWNASTACDPSDDEPGSICSVTWFESAGLRTSRAAAVQCVEQGYRLDFGTFVVWFSRPLAVAGVWTPDCSGLDQLEAGPFLPSGTWHISAFADGRTLDVGLTVDGRLIAGEFTVDLSCPCLPDR